MPPETLRRLRTAHPLLTFCLLILSAATAHAECAWVFWEQTVYIRIPSGVPNTTPTPSKAPQPSWTLHTATVTAGECQQAKQRRWEELRTLYPNPDGAPSDSESIVRIGRGPDGYARWPISHRLHCFPDTVDPRGPKAR